VVVTLGWHRVDKHRPDAPLGVDKAYYSSTGMEFLTNTQQRPMVQPSVSVKWCPWKPAPWRIAPNYPKVEAGEGGCEEKEETLSVQREVPTMKQTHGVCPAPRR
jgi:hypothetical protein